MGLSDKEKQRYSRHLLLDKVGEGGQLKLKNAKVLVIGAGGLGCPILSYLVAAGVGNVGIIDFDTVDETNLQRQILFDTKDIGKNKAIVAKEKLTLQNPFIKIITYNEELTNKNALALFNQYDIIVDGTDNFPTRYMVNDACLLTEKPLVYGAIHKFEGQVSVFNYKGGPNYRDLFPNPPSSDSIPSCSEAGVIGVLPGIIGTQQANEVIKIILEIGNIASGKLIVYNALQTSFLKINIPNSNNIEVKNIQEFEAYDYSLNCELTQVLNNQITKETFNKLPKESFVLDVREEWEVPKINNKQILNSPLGDLRDFVDEIPKDKPVYVVCQKGVRSKNAIMFLEEKYGFKNLINLEGGLT